jgi:hypothetical protein
MNALSTDPSNPGAPEPTESGDQLGTAERGPGTSQDAAGPPPTDDPIAHEAAQVAPDPVEPPD